MRRLGGRVTAGEDRVDRLARRLALADRDIVAGGAPSAPDIESAFDGVARVLVTPMTRRRAVMAVGGAIVAGSLLRPGRAHAQGQCPSGGPNVCTSPAGNGLVRRVCVPANLACCSNENCAIACPYPWRVCEAPAVCSDTAAMCRDTTNPDYDVAKTKFCSQRVSVTNGCVASGSSIATRGWCCKTTELCGTEFGDCLCATPCGSDCCKKGEECVNPGILSSKVCLPACRKGWHHDGFDCVCDSGQTCGTKCCPAGTECGSGSTCVKPAPPKSLPSIWDAFQGFGDTASQSAGSHGGGGSRQALRLRLAGAAATGPVNGALLALAAVNAQGAAAGSAWSDEHVDRNYRRKVVAAKPSAPGIAPGVGLDIRAAKALEALLAAESKGFALAFASATALARARGANRRHDLKAARRQVLAAAGFAEKASKALHGVPALRASAAAALTATGATEVVVSAAEVQGLQATVRSSGVPADLRDELRSLGIRGADLTRVRDAMLVTSMGGPTLIAPLADPARTKNLRALSAELAKFAKAARRRPISTSPGAPRKYRTKPAASARRR